tara:strand:+ start:16 stop:168 length:153 start_codon:yes stop_codon:yes gene_type:complete
MDKYQMENWKKIRDHFETLPEKERDNWFYKRAVAFTEGKQDPLPELPKEE